MFDGTRLRELRQKQDLTLKDLAERSDVSLSMISQIERGKADPTLTTLYKICKGLEIPLSMLVVDDAEEFQIVRADERRVMNFPDSRSRYEFLTPSHHGGVEMLMIHLEPGTHNRHQVQHTGEECGLVLSGILTVSLAGEEHVLRPGDSIRYLSTLPHRLHNDSDEVTVSVWAMTGQAL